MTINTTAISELLKPGLNSVFADANIVKAQWKEIFEVSTSDMAQETDVEVKMLGLASVMQEGAATSFGSMGQQTVTNYVHRYVGIGYIITRQAIQDNLYKSKFPMQAKALANSFAATKETICAAVLNNGFDSNYPTGDGQPLYSTSHPLSGGTFANTFTTQADLNETSLQDAIVAIQRFQSAAGLRMQAKPRKMVIGPWLQFQASRLLNSQFQAETANNAINAINYSNMIPQGFVVNQYLTDQNAFHILTDVDNGFRYFQREPMETDVRPAEDTWSIKVLGIERYSAGVSNTRAAFASSGSS